MTIAISPRSKELVQNKANHLVATYSPKILENRVHQLGRMTKLRWRKEVMVKMAVVMIGQGAPSRTFVNKCLRPRIGTALQ